MLHVPVATEQWGAINCVQIELNIVPRETYTHIHRNIDAARKNVVFKIVLCGGRVSNVEVIYAMTAKNN